MHVSCSAYRGIKKQQNKGVKLTFEYCVFYCAGHFLVWGAAIVAAVFGFDLLIAASI